MKKILMVCMGNICRSPTAHAVLQNKVERLGLTDQISVDSAGTHAYHVGEQSDSRSRQLASSKGIDMEYIRSRKIAVRDYDEFDCILAMDDDNLELIDYYKPDHYSAQIRLFLSYANQQGLINERTVPDPYYGGEQGFEHVFTLIDQGCDALIHYLLTNE